uniref:Gustatory receptor n=1 Tax=Lutzomyia longipalpis TaxID=7200 RepID=A0A1B0EUR7_LUTLO
MDSLHNAIGPFICLAQFLGIMPVVGILSKNASDVKFKWTAFRTMYAVAVSTFAFIEWFLSAYRIHAIGFSLGNAEALAFYTITMVGHFFFFNLATRWPKIVRCWDKVEKIFLSNPYQPYGRRLDTRVRIVCCSWIALGMIEYSLYLCVAFIGIYYTLEICPDSSVGILEIFFKSQRSHIFMWIKFHTWMTPFLTLVNMSLTFCWTYLDLFIMASGLALATRFNQITQRLKIMQNLAIPESFWVEIRSHYLILNELILFIDDQLSQIILLSCASNLYFICLQLYNSFKNNYTDLLSTFYFWFSLLFVIGRASCAILCAASIHAASKTPLKILRNVPTKYWNLELGRFTYSVTKDTIALTGKKFFFLTKGLLLVMAGSVVTYELVVLDQVHDGSGSSENDTHPCNWTN